MGVGELILAQLFPGKDVEKEFLHSALVMRMVTARLETGAAATEEAILRAWIKKYPEDGYSYVARAILELFADRPKEAYKIITQAGLEAKNERSEIALAKEKLLASFPELHLIELNAEAS